ncbi:hypothetical protein FHX48_002764 [Microbacterium halimionae]|uniref:YdhG-like domain-containing protein n=1 Tax=Microbacterium halimionae TaxID=1526413 RepID=A0A7W3JRG5_9MICO|nr:DUF1801 domain-containing protein [Microbacterium halimionae]MBA8817659.1 hypothetical protein [Microbacterium halimionae]NII94762.1 hypothetical protein [Microbacterium halimionae]
MTHGEQDVDEWLDLQTHDLIDGARAVRAAILRTVPDATESVKWQAPNFALDDDFATFSMRRPGTLQVILHTGAKPKPELPAIQVDDVGGRLKWASHNRAIVTFTSNQDVVESLPQFEKTVGAWVKSL